MPKKSHELFVMVDGKPVDGPIHEAILAEGDEAAALEVARQVARRSRLTAEDIELLYGPESEDGTVERGAS